MSAVINNTTERRQNNQHLVSELKQERQQVWSLYCKVGEQKPFSASTEISALLTQFTQLLIDYASLGHFGIYEHLLSGTERRTAVLTAAKDIYPEFSETTEFITSFNDRYEDNSDLSKLESDLSILGEHLAKRIDIEDRLCRFVLGQR